MSNSLTVTLDKSGMKVKCSGSGIGTYQRIKIIGLGDNPVFRLKSNIPVSEAYPFEDNLEFVATKDWIKAINHIDLEKYISGVVESEIGNVRNPDFLKAKSIICRTYALGNLRRHASEGYELCDKEHCQVYKSKSRFNPAIKEAVEESRDLIIVDSNRNLITAAFHANCGGMTVNSEDVWTYSLPYLRAVQDTFCIGSPGSTWQRIIPTRDWSTYLTKFNDNIIDSLFCDSTYSYHPQSREISYKLNTENIPLKKIRSDWAFRSTWFDLQTECDSVIIKGRGFGHGVGLCQEGAMKMAEQGFKYDEIINYYYRNVSIISLAGLKLLKN